jgi:hypothetical protein
MIFLYEKKKPDFFLLQKPLVNVFLLLIFFSLSSFCSYSHLSFLSLFLNNINSLNAGDVKNIRFLKKKYHAAAAAMDG